MFTPHEAEQITAACKARDRAFVCEYLRTMDATKAYLATHPRCKTSATARSKAPLVMARPSVRRFLELQLWKRSRLTKDDVLEGLGKIARGNLGDFLSWEQGHLKIRDSVELTPDHLAALSEVKQTEHGLAFKLHSKLEALRELAKILGMVVDRQAVTNTNVPATGGAIDLTKLTHEQLKQLDAILAAAAVDPASSPGPAGGPAEQSAPAGGGSV